MALTPIKDIHVGQIWMAASGCKFGYEVIAIQQDIKEAVVRRFNKTSYEIDLWTIDLFKLTYRYTLFE